MKEEVKKLLEKGIIKPSTSEWASPPMIQRKPDGDWRFLIDLRKLNAMTKRDSYPMPNTTRILHSLQNAIYITTIDLMSGYFQFPIHKDHTQFTAFMTDDELYEFLFTAQGLCGAPPKFQRMMDHILRPFKFSFCFVYLDDIIIFSFTFEDHIKHVTTILKKLAECQLIISLKKCHWCVSSVKFLGPPELGDRPAPGGGAVVWRF